MLPAGFDYGYLSALRSGLALNTLVELGGILNNVGMNTSNSTGLLGLLVCFGLYAAVAGATPFPLPPAEGDSVIGEIRYILARPEDTLVDIGREFGLGYEDMIAANPKVNRWVPGEGTKVILPTRFILPLAKPQGIVLNLPELRLYYFPTVKKGSPALVHTFPVSVGRMDWRTPLGATKVVRKDRNPPWYPTESIRQARAKEGEILPRMIPGGDPENPLGAYALRLGLPAYLIHGVDERKSYGIGMRVTHGCIRMFPSDIEWLYQNVPVNTPVMLINQPIKAGWLNGNLYLEVHQPLEEEAEDLPEVTVGQALQLLATIIRSGVRVDEKLVAEVVARGDGVPVIVGIPSR